MNQITLTQEMFNNMIGYFAYMMILSAFFGGIVATWFNDVLDRLISVVERVARRFARKPPLLSHKRY